MSCKECKVMENALIKVVNESRKIKKHMKLTKKTRGRQGLSRNDIRAILILSSRRGLSIREIACETGFSKSVVGKYIKLNKDCNSQLLSRIKLSEFES